MRADPRPAKRIVDPEAGTAKIKREARCRLCGSHAVTRHHLVPKGGANRGDDIDANIVPLCGSGTTGCHGKVEAMDKVARRRLRRTLRPEEVAYIDWKRGRWWLDLRYPL